MFSYKDYKKDIIQLHLKNGWKDVRWVYDDIYGGIYLGGVSPITGKWEHIDVDDEETERSYCLICRDEMITESDQVCKIK